MQRNVQPRVDHLPVEHDPVAPTPGAASGAPPRSAHGAHPGRPDQAVQDRHRRRRRSSAGPPSSCARIPWPHSETRTPRQLCQQASRNLSRWSVALRVAGVIREELQDVAPQGERQAQHDTRKEGGSGTRFSADDVDGQEEHHQVVGEGRQEGAEYPRPRTVHHAAESGTGDVHSRGDQGRHEGLLRRAQGGMNSQKMLPTRSAPSSPRRE